MTMFVFWVAPAFVSIVTFGTCMLTGIPLESGNVLSVLGTFRILQESINSLPESISMIAEIKISRDRIVSFLRIDGLSSDATEMLPKGTTNKAIEMINGNFSWDLSSQNKTLKDINVTVFHGMRVAVCGAVGSGKSGLLSSILEVPKVSGNIKVSGTKAYVAQSPWIQSGTIEKNILFGKDMVREMYDKVLEACSLEKDIEILSFGDQTIIVERGSHLFNEFLLGLLRPKTVIYVIHQVEFLPAAVDLILVMKDGKITQSGKYSDMLNSGTHFAEPVGSHKKALSTLDSLDEVTGSDKLSTLEQDIDLLYAQEVEENVGTKDVKTGKSDEINEQKGQLIEEEEREKEAKAVTKPFTLINVYASLSLGCSLFILIRAMLLAIASFKTATILFSKMNFCIFCAPMSLFDATPSGRFLNRASTDQSTVDTIIPHKVGGFSFSIIQLLGIVVIMSQVAWQVIFIFVPVILISTRNIIYHQHKNCSDSLEYARLQLYNIFQKHYLEEQPSEASIKSLGFKRQI
ncbi:hypothetical protein K1719_021019 [Acacia pycnantha]|nr:hypothetical protein K1719_021019 [Acacia pycnantha]